MTYRLDVIVSSYSLIQCCKAYTESLVSCSLGFLPSVLTGHLLIHLIRECAVKFNDYFEFPRDIDMEPFTELGLAKLQGEVPLDVMSVLFRHILQE